MAVPTTSWPLCTTDHVACTFGRSPEMSVKVSPASVVLNTWPVPTAAALSPSEPIGAQNRAALAPTVTYTVFGSCGSGVTDVITRPGNPLAAATCQPCAVPR